MAYEPGAPHSIKIIDTEICSAKLKAEHPELFHYTGRGGFEPIVKTNTLWATHFRNLNDDAEISTRATARAHLWTRGGKLDSLTETLRQYGTGDRRLRSEVSK